MLLSAHGKRFSISRMQDFCLQASFIWHREICYQQSYEVWFTHYIIIQFQCLLTFAKLCQGSDSQNFDRLQIGFWSGRYGLGCKLDRPNNCFAFFSCHIGFSSFGGSISRGNLHEALIGFSSCRGSITRCFMTVCSILYCLGLVAPLIEAKKEEENLVCDLVNEWIKLITTVFIKTVPGFVWVH